MYFSFWVRVREEFIVHYMNVKWHLTRFHFGICCYSARLTAMLHMTGWYAYTGRLRRLCVEADRNQALGLTIIRTIQGAHTENNNWKKCIMNKLRVCVVCMQKIYEETIEVDKNPAVIRDTAALRHCHVTQKIFRLRTSHKTVIQPSFLINDRSSTVYFIPTFHSLYISIFVIECY